MSVTNILQQIQSTLTKKYNSDVDIQSSDVDEMFGPGFVNQYANSTDDDVDVTDAGTVDVPYTTSRPIPVPKGKKAGSNYLPFGEAKKEEDSPDDEDDEDDVSADDEADMASQAAEEEIEDATGDDLEVGDEEIAAGEEEMAGGEEEEAAGEEDISGGDMGDTGNDMGDSAMGDSAMGDAGMGDMGGMGQEEEEKSSGEIGRIYELKKIYTRLTSIEAYLSDESDKEILDIRSYVSQGIELFEIVSANFNSYEKKLDEIIVIYYKFLMEVYKSVKDFYSSKKNNR